VLEIVLVLLNCDKNCAKLIRRCQIQCNFWGIDDLCKSDKEYL